VRTGYYFFFFSPLQPLLILQHSLYFPPVVPIPIALLKVS